ncbi:Ubiquitin-like-specific protease 1A [Zea mays]|uniref:Ubiquitin-like-specific protease 1A n=1 Tax=Zea mays TaxID=4577 RepID=A0A3L6EUR6_MAIZE|nr:Ubiquitin-like-specific protease 1A [Zea mays]
MVEQNKQDALDTLIRISQHKKPKKLNVARVVSEGNIFRILLVFTYIICLLSINNIFHCIDYKCTPEDVQLIEYIKTLPGKQVVVNIDSAWLNRNDMKCLFHGDIQLSDEALSAYIHCIRGEEHLLHREGGKVFLENTFISSLLKRDGDPKVLLNCKEDTIEKRVDNYLQSDMVFLPMNIENFHWYLAVLNAKKSEVHVLDSMGQQITDRKNLYTILKGLERQIKLAAKHKELYQGKWSNLDVASWPVIEKITTQMQTDGVSCGLWMINYIEYWIGSSLSDNVTQV